MRLLTGSTQRRISTVTNNKSLAQVGRDIHIEQYISPAAGTIAISDGTIADTMEAIIGAVYLDGGLEAAKEVIERLGLQ